ncbi:MAG: aquaporin, partial [Eubacteriales bacterium]|nr:aquaporin [Eubacteriales bacterium]
VAATTSKVGALNLTQATLMIALAFGLVIVAMAYSIGNISGCHINPAVSFGMWLSGRMTLKDMLLYWAAQFLGGIAGAGVLSAVFHSSAALGQNGFGATMPIQVGWVGAFAVEVVLTFVFVIAIIGVTSKPEFSGVAGIVIGLTLTLVHIFGIPFTGTSVNPARSFGPALLAGGVAIGQVWVFILAPLVGAAIAAFVYKFLSAQKADK